MQTWKVALPMYNVGPTLTADYERFLEAVIAVLRARGWTDAIEVVRDIDDLEHFWLRSDLLLSQTCGYPLTTSLHGQVQLLGTPTYDVPGCSGVSYRSLLVVRADDSDAGMLRSMPALADFRGSTGVVNQLNSHSGMNALRHTVAPFAHKGYFFDKVHVSGSHLDSLVMVQNGSADVAAIDCVTFAYVARACPDKVFGLRILQESLAAPGLPFIASLQLNQTQSVILVEALEKVCVNRQIAEPLRITGLALTVEKDYQAIMAMEEFAIALGYPRLA
ncbi:phosphate/phosphite/phosphonate ABC transporter substrate-binding protein [Glaciimonas sp. GNP009]